MHPANFNSQENRVFSQDLCFFVEFLTRLLYIVLQAKQSKQLLTEEICLISEATMYIYFLIEIDEKGTKLSLFYLMHPANSNSHENRIFSRDLSAFLSNF